MTITAPVESYPRLPIDPALFSFADQDKEYLTVISLTCDYVLDHWANHPYTAFLAFFVDKHSNHLFVYGLHFIFSCLCIFVTLGAFQETPTLPYDLHLYTD